MGSKSADVSPNSTRTYARLSPARTVPLPSGKPRPTMALAMLSAEMQVILFRNITLDFKI